MDSDGRYLRHDSGIVIDAEDSWVRLPNIFENPDADDDVIREAVQKWIAARLALPAPEPEPRKITLTEVDGCE